MPLPFGSDGRDLPGELGAALESNPLAGVEYTGIVQLDTASELNALQAAFRARRTREDKRFRLATDSEYWIALCFESRDEKESFLEEFAIRHLGDKYLDGSRVAGELRKR